MLLEVTCLLSTWATKKIVTSLAIHQFLLFLTTTVTKFLKADEYILIFVYYLYFTLGLVLYSMKK